MKNDEKEKNKTMKNDEKEMKKNNEKWWTIETTMKKIKKRKKTMKQHVHHF